MSIDLGYIPERQSESRGVLKGVLELVLMVARPAMAALALSVVLGSMLSQPGVKVGPPAQPDKTTEADQKCGPNPPTPLHVESPTAASEIFEAARRNAC